MESKSTNECGQFLDVRAITLYVLLYACLLWLNISSGPTGSSQRFVLFNGVQSSPVSIYPNVSVRYPEDGHVGYLFPAWNYLFKQKATPNLLP